MFISAGHSNTDPGAVGWGRREADIATEMRNIVSFYLTRAGVAHALDGSGTNNMPLGQAVKLSRQHKLSVEFHCNAGPEKATGVEVLCAPKDNATAAKICTAISSVLGIRNRGVKPENAGQHHRLAFVQAGGMIVELFFISNRDDLRAYDERKWLLGRELAQLLAMSK